MKVQTGLKAGSLISQTTHQTIGQQGLVNVGVNANVNANVLSGNKIG
jgi:hypothetical protein